ncbi:hypothetical protein KIW_08425 [Pediococcus acidilactici MA18/5M]|nr:hypothetical protein KIW_08425 [Pediococcus acidilactici MA18/5M]
MTFTRFDYAAVESEKIDSQVLFICAFYLQNQGIFCKINLVKESQIKSLTFFDQCTTIRK